MCPHTSPSAVKDFIFRAIFKLEKWIDGVGWMGRFMDEWMQYIYSFCTIGDQVLLPQLGRLSLLNCWISGGHKFKGRSGDEGNMYAPFYDYVQVSWKVLSVLFKSVDHKFQGRSGDTRTEYSTFCIKGIASSLTLFWNVLLKLPVCNGLPHKAQQWHATYKIAYIKQLAQFTGYWGL